MKRGVQDVAARKANLLEAAVIIPSLAAGLVAAIVTARMTADQSPLAQLVRMAAVTFPAHYAVRGLLRLMVRDTQHRLHAAAGCVDCTSHS